jgi:hypothetical protein
MLGTASYMFSPRKPVFTLDIYTQKGGEGAKVSGGVFFYNETVTFFACVKDSDGHQLRDIHVEVTISSPLNIVQKEETITGGKGVGTISFAIPYPQPALKTLVEVWNVDAEAKIGEETVRDSLTFEVRALPSIDIYTNKGGKGHNVSSDAFFNAETITVYVNVTEAVVNIPLENVQVRFQSRGPLNSFENITYSEERITDANGICIMNLTTLIQSKPLEIVIGIWNITATVESTEDTLVFEVKKTLIRGIDVFTDKGGRGMHKPCLRPFYLNETITIYAEVTNGTKPLSGVFVAFGLENFGNKLSIFGQNTTDGSGIAIWNFRIPLDDTWLGTWVVYANIDVPETGKSTDTLTFECKASE